ncbi:DUF1903-domain-containing protein [Coniochaeta sp. PMI_546]|nr:DUF1903-domain-containing protein [Coniochaeta sp. PMI_546]
MGLQDDLNTKPPCHPRACAIQDCLTRNNYNEAKCEKFVDALYECCQAFYEKNGEHAQTVSCPKFDLLKLKIKQRQDKGSS